MPVFKTQENVALMRICTQFVLSNREIANHPVRDFICPSTNCPLTPKTLVSVEPQGNNPTTVHNENSELLLRREREAILGEISLTPRVAGDNDEAVRPLRRERPARSQQHQEGNSENDNRFHETSPAN